MREKKKQRVVYDPGKTMINRPPSWKRSASEELAGSSSKRARRAPEREEYLMNTFMEQLEIHVSSEIRHCYQTGGNLGELRKSRLSRSRLPRGIVTGAEARINVKAGEMESLLRTKRSHGKTSAQYWKDFVEAEFFNIAQRIRKEVERREETTEEAEDTSAQEQEEPQIRTFSASLLPLLRSDLPADIQDTFLKTIEEAAVSDSDYIASYSVQVYKLILLLKKPSFFFQVR